MINLSGVKDADISIKEELYLAGIEAIPFKGEGEVPYTIIGKVGNWVFHRAWYYWIVKTENPADGLPLKDAMKLHNKPNPVNSDKILGTTIRSGGHCGCPSPDEYGADPVYDEELNQKLIALGYEEKELFGKKYVDINVGEISKLNEEGKLDVPFYVDNYHIDDQVGLNEFAKFLKEYYKNNRLYLKKLHIDEDTELYCINTWNNMNGIIHNDDGSGYWVKDDKISNDEVFHTKQQDATHVIWYGK